MSIDELAEFTIKLQGPVDGRMLPNERLSLDIGPEVRIASIQWIQDVPENFILKITFWAEDLDPTDCDALREFRRRAVDAIALAVMAPIRMTSGGAFRFHRGGSEVELFSFPDGIASLQAPRSVNSAEPLARAMMESPQFAGAVYFLHQALASRSELDRFFNIAVSFELLIAAESPLSGSVPPRCTKPECGFVLDKCPCCDREWKIPRTLDERAAFLFPDVELRRRFIRARNTTFHPSTERLSNKFRNELAGLNRELVRHLRNTLAAKVGLQPMVPATYEVAIDEPLLRVKFADLKEQDSVTRTGLS